ncbi:dehydrogenase, partial [Thioclava sp. BHET1]
MTFDTIVLTGASGGLGQSLARALARPGRRLLLAGRDSARLE